MNHKILINPILKNPVLFIFLYIIINIPVCIFWVMQYFPNFKYVLLSVPITSFTAYIFTTIASLISVSKVFIYIVIYILSIFEAYLILNFGTRFSPTIFQLIAETTPNEVEGFFTTYLFTPQSLIYTIIATILAAINVFVERSQFVKNLVSNFVYRFVYRFSILVSFLILFCGALSIYRDVRFVHCLLVYPYTEVPDKISSHTYGTKFTTFGNIIFAGYMYNSTSNDADRLAETMAGISNVTANYTSKNVVFILGESFNKYHSSLYGYSLPTNQFLEKEKNNLFVMSDVVSPHNTTSKCLRKLFSFSNQDNNLYWATTPLFPALYKYVGYNVSYLSNQESLQSSENIFDVMNNSFVNELTIPYLYDYVNSNVYDFDMDLVKEYERIKQDTDTNSPKLVVFHLIGQHMGYNNRYPESDVIFTKQDYQHRTDLNDAQKEMVAHYDNATSYNDKVVSSIIDLFRNEDAVVVYLSDHSDEVYDYRDYIGRSYEAIITKGRAMYQYEVPFMIWVSDKYKERHPCMIDKLSKSINRPFMTDDLPHLMLELAGIKYNLFDPTRSLINDQYNAGRKRLLGDTKQDYDEIIESTTFE